MSWICFTIITGGVVDVDAKLNPNNPGGASTWITVDEALSVAVAVSVSSSRRRRTLSWVLTTAEAEIRVVAVVVVDKTGASIGFVFDDAALSILIDLFVILLTYFVLLLILKYLFVQ